ncbi:23488_t:CDS:2 [Cetraspora pellucida]|uniref:23488_t:CDS:1 n=1 Tax=Cetraspora pellucida TaxID=1433469 RepID=A0A9N9HC05_9GLOM|nr:23488_t:CDS:2 [Cetraspora pellucida]
MDGSRNEHYGYFEQKPSKWDIIEFLEQCDLEPYGKKVDRYIRCLRCIACGEQKKRKEKAEELLRRYSKGNKPDQQRVKDWEKTCKSSKISGGSSIHIHNIHNSTLSGNSLTIAGNTSTTKRKREGLRESKVVSYAESSTDTDTSFDSNCEESRSVKRQSNRFDIKESTTYNYEVESDYDFSNFELAYRALDPSKMWVLNSSGRVVEKVIYDHARELEYDSYLHSFIINDADMEAKKLFNKNEWNEIFSSNPKQVPKIDEKIVNLLKKYNVDNLPTLQKVIFEPLFSDNAPYSTDLDYINLAYRSMYSLWRGEDDFTSASKLEGWFEMNIWAHLVDPAFREMETDLVRGEGMCLSSSDRKNTDRLRNKRLEFGAIEAGRNWEGTKGTKLLTNSLKMSKMLKDMINVLATECNMKEDVLRKLQIAGILQGANMMQVITVDLPMGYVTCIHRRKFYEVPGRLNKYQPLGFIIMEVLFVKSVIKQTLNLINESKVDFEHFLNNYYENDGSQTPPQNIVSLTSSTHITPEKKMSSRSSRYYSTIVIVG